MREMVLFMFFVAVVSLSSACGHGQKACAIIDLAHTACETIPIRYLTPDGEEKMVYVPKYALVALGEAQPKDAGVDGE